MNPGPFTLQVSPSARAAGATSYRRAQPTAASANLLKLDANEGPYSLARELLAVPDILPEILREYPDASSLESLLCARLAVDPDRLIVTAGGDDALCRICQSILDTGSSAIASSPTFEMIPRYVRLAGACLREVPWFDGPFPTEQFQSAIDRSTKAIFVVTPNNPTGNIATGRDLSALSAAAPGALLVVDLAYTEFADQDLTAAALALPNAIIVRTLSKAWGLAGLRIGYAVGPPTVISWLRAVGQPYAVASPSAAIASWALDHLGAPVDAGIRQVRAEREQLATILRAQGCTVIPSQANFVLTQTPRAEQIASSLSRDGILVRRFTGRPELANCLRITCPGDPALSARLLRSLEQSR